MKENKSAFLAVISKTNRGNNLLTIVKQKIVNWVKRKVSMESQNIALLSDKLITPLEFKKNAVLLIEDGKISDVGFRENIVIPKSFKIVDVGDLIVAPGFIDIHNHGGLGMMVAYDGEKAVVDNAERLVETGCTGWLPTVNTLESLPVLLFLHRGGDKWH